MLKKTKIKIIPALNTELQLKKNGVIFWISGPNGTFFRYLNKSFQRPSISGTILISKNKQALFIRILKSKLESNFSFYSVSKKLTVINLKKLTELLKSQFETMALCSITGFNKTLIVRGVGFKFKQKNTYLSLQVGYSHEMNVVILSIFNLKLNRKNTALMFKTTLVSDLHNLLARIRSLRKADIYKGKGIRYKKECIKRKEGKKKKIA